MYRKQLYYYILLIFVAIILSTSYTKAQIPNAGFESWTSGSPDNWIVNSTSQFQTVIQSTDAHTGSYSLEGTVVSFSGFTYGAVVTTVFNYNQRPSSLSGYYKLNSVGSDTLLIVFASYKNGNGIGGGIFETSVSANSYTQFNLPITYVSGDTPDSVGISISLMPVLSLHSGTTFNIDDLSFGSGATRVENSFGKIPQAFRLEQNYPNPFNPSTKIEYQIPKLSHVSLKVYDILGNQVATLVNEEQPAGKYSINFNASKLSSGIYFYRIDAAPSTGSAQGFVQTKKLILLK